jgi:hypothetical protein
METTLDTASLERRLAAIETRLEELEDDRAIREVLARYGYNADMGRHDAWIDLFTLDGSISYPVNKDVVDGPATPKNTLGTARPETEAYPRHTGREQLKAMISKPDGQHMNIEGRSLHIQGLNLRTTITGATAIAEAYNIMVVREGSAFELMSGSIGRWTLEKMDGRWRIKDSTRRHPGSVGFEKVLLPDT